jgi:hypothetical protein
MFEQASEAKNIQFYRKAEKAYKAYCKKHHKAFIVPAISDSTIKINSYAVEVFLKNKKESKAYDGLLAHFNCSINKIIKLY